MFVALLLLLSDGPRLNLGDLEIYKTPVVASSPEGYLCLAEPDGAQLFFVDPTGALIARAGSRGFGPQAFQQAYRIQWLETASAFLLFDLAQNRVSLWRKDGTFVDVKKVPDARGDAFFSMPDRYFQVRDPGLAGTAPVLDRLGKAEPLTLWRGKPYAADVGLRFQNQSTRFKWDPRVLAAKNETWVAVFPGLGRQLVLFDPKTNKRQERTLQLAPVPLTDAVFEWYVRRYAQPQQKAIRQTYKSPDYYPLVMDMMFDYNDRLWLFGTERRVVL